MGERKSNKFFPQFNNHFCGKSIPPEVAAVVLVGDVLVVHVALLEEVGGGGDRRGGRLHQRVAAEDQGPS